MKTRTRTNWNPLLVLAVLGIGGGLLYCWLTPGGSCPFAFGNNHPTSLESVEGEAMSTHVETHHGVLHADPTTFEREVLHSDVPVLVDFYADWCGPCQALAPVLEEFARESPGVKVVKVNVDDSPQLAARYAVSSIPSLRVFQDGRVTAQHTGLPGKGQLQALVGR